MVPKPSKKDEDNPFRGVPVLSFFLFLGVWLAHATNDLQSSYNLLNLPAQIKSGSTVKANYTYLSDLTGMVFSELGKGGKVDSYRRYLQRRFVSAAIDAMNGRGAENTDGRALILGTLTELQKKAAKAKSSDTATQAHWQTIAKTIEKALK